MSSYKMGSIRFFVLLTFAGAFTFKWSKNWKDNWPCYISTHNTDACFFLCNRRPGCGCGGDRLPAGRPWMEHQQRQWLRGRAQQPAQQLQRRGLRQRQPAAPAGLSGEGQAAELQPINSTTHWNTAHLSPFNNSHTQSCLINPFSPLSLPSSLHHLLLRQISIQASADCTSFRTEPPLRHPPARIQYFIRGRS